MGLKGIPGRLGDVFRGLWSVPGAFQKGSRGIPGSFRTISECAKDNEFGVHRSNSLEHNHCCIIIVPLLIMCCADCDVVQISI